MNVLTVQDAGRTGLSDREQLTFALSERRVMVTMDSDFLKLAVEGVAHAGIGYANPRTTIRELISALMLLHDVLTPGEMVNTAFERSIKSLGDLSNRLCNPINREAF